MSKKNQRPVEPTNTKPPTGTHDVGQKTFPDTSDVYERANPALQSPQQTLDMPAVTEPQHADKLAHNRAPNSTPAEQSAEHQDQAPDKTASGTPEMQSTK
jgi:hypothetical protein